MPEEVHLSEEQTSGVSPSSNGMPFVEPDQADEGQLTKLCPTDDSGIRAGRI